MTPNDENLQQAYMMLLNSKRYLHKVKEVWKLKEDEIDELCGEISVIQNRIYELIHLFDFDKEEYDFGGYLIKDPKIREELEELD